MNRSIVIAALCALYLSACALNNATTPATAGDKPTAKKGTTAPNAEALVERAIEEQRLKQAGVQPGTKKAEILLKWQRAVRDAPDLRARFPTGIPPVESPAGRALIADGMTRISPAKRSEFWSLYARVAGAHLPDDCYGQRSAAAISSRLMTFPNLTDEDTDEYLGLIAAMLQASVQASPQHVPTAAEHTAATIALGKLMMTEVKDKADADRLAQVTVNPSGASVTDACWVMKASIRSIDRLPPNEKEIVLAGTSLQAAAAAASKLPRPSLPGPASAPVPARPAARQL
ncbi:hypothetical protein [Paraburkholderia youngii]|uniref:hypothetical protein n=1 Tax=Paraburkholderia youngii TaxID=2782701 RepID=UPI0015927150|nr:hypothetical protein [Paraburkholderia youngii]NUX59337.1 hypothetical protein [Paraburkholderia youngii]